MNRETRDRWDTGQRDLSLLGYDLKLTCPASPEQYDVFLGDQQVGYLRLRHGNFTAEAPDCGGTLVYEAETAGDAMFERDERDAHLNAAILAIDKHRAGQRPHHR